MIYKVTKIESKPRSFLKAINHGIQSNVNEITLHMEKQTKWFGPFNWTVKYRAEFVVPMNTSIYDYLSVGDLFDASQYPSIKISKI